MLLDADDVTYLERAGCQKVGKSAGSKSRCNT